MRAAHTVTILSIVETVLSSVHFTSETGMIEYFLYSKFVFHLPNDST